MLYSLVMRVRFRYFCLLVFLLLGGFTACEIEEKNYEAEIEWLTFQARGEGNSFQDLLRGDTVRSPGQTVMRVKPDFPNGTDLTCVIPVFRLSKGATADVVSGKPMDLTKDLVMTVTSENGRYKRQYRFVVGVNPTRVGGRPDGQEEETKNTETGLSDFQLEGIAAKVEPRGVNIYAEVEESVDLTRVTPTWKLSKGATSEPQSGTPHNFAKEPLFVWVTAEDGRTRTKYRIEAHHPEVIPNSAAQLLAFRFGECKEPGVISGSKIYVNIDPGLSAKSLTPIYTMTEGATCDLPIGVQPLDFSKPKKITVTSEDGNATSVYTVHVSGGKHVGAELKEIDVYGAIGQGKPHHIEGNTYTFLFKDGDLKLEEVRIRAAVSEKASQSWSAGTGADWTGCLEDAAEGLYSQTLTVRSEDGEHQSLYRIQLRRVAVTKDYWLSSFGFDGIPSEVKIVEHDIFCTVPAGTDITRLVPTFTSLPSVGDALKGRVEVWNSKGRKTDPNVFQIESGVTAVDFTATKELYVYYTLWAAYYPKATYRIHFLFKSDPDKAYMSREPELKDFRFEGMEQVVPARMGNTWLFTVGEEVDARRLKPSFRCSRGAKAEGLTSGKVTDFSSPKTLTLKSGDGSREVVYTIKVQKGQNDRADVLSFRLVELDLTPSIRGTSITFFAGTDVAVSSLTPEYTVSRNARAEGLQLGQPHDFSTPAKLTVRSEDGSLVKVYTVQVIQQKNFEADLLSFAFRGVDEKCTIKGIIVEYPEEVKGVSSLVPVFRVSPGAVADMESNGKAYDFSEEVKLSVTSEDGTQTKVYRIRQKRPQSDFSIRYDFETWEDSQGYFRVFKTPAGGWASANDGAAFSIKTIGKPSRYPVNLTSQAHGGSKAAAIETLEVGYKDVSIMAGALFIGSFNASVLSTNPLRAPRFGLPWPAGKYRPARFQGWYKYTPGPVMTGGGGTDDFSIYAIFYYGSQLEAPDVPGCNRIIARAEVAKHVANGAWTYFDIPFEELIAKDKIPSNATLRYSIVTTSSKDGAEYKGAVGSMLIVDDFAITLK